MDYKDWIIPELKAYDGKRKSLQNTLDQIKELELKATAIKATVFDKDVVDGGGDNKRDEMLMENILKRQELETNYEATKVEVANIEHRLSQLSDEDRFILETFFIYKQYNPVERLCDVLCIEQAQVYRRREKALKNYALLTCGGQVKC